MGLADVVAVLRADTTEFTAKLDEASAKVAAFSTEGSSGMSKLSSALGAVPLPVVAIGAAAVVAGAACFELGEKFTQTTASIAANAGISTQAAASIGNAFLSTGGTTTFTGQQMAAAFAAVAGQVKELNGGVLNSSAAMTVMKASMDLAEASGTGLGNSTQDVTKTLQAFGLGVSSSPLVANVLFNAARDTGTNVDALTTSLDKARAQMGAGAPPIQALGGLLVDLANHGETGRAAMSTLSTTMTSLLKPTAADTAAQVALLGHSFVDAQGNLEPMGQIIADVSPKIAGMGNAQATATLVSLGFGSASSKLVQTIQAGAGAYDAATASVSKTGSAHAAAAKQTDTLGGSFDKIKSAAEDVATKLGVSMQPAVASLAKDLSKFAADVIKDWPQISAAIKTAIDIVKPFLEALITKIKGVIEVFQGIIEFLKGVFTGNWSEAWEGIKKILGGAFDAIIGSVLKLFAPFTAEFKKIWSTVTNDIHSAWSDIINFFTGIPGKILSALGDLGSTLASWATKAWHAVTTAFTTAWDDTATWFKGIWTKITTALGDLAGDFTTFMTNAWHAVTNAFTTAWSDTASFLSGIWGKITAAIGDLATDFYDWMHAAFERVKDAFTDAWNDVASWLGKLWTAITGAIGDLATDMYNWMHAAFERVKDAFSDAWNDVSSFLSGLWGKITAAIGDLGTDMYNFAHAAWERVKDGFTDAWTDVSTWLGNVAASIVTAIGDLSKTLFDAGKAVIGGLLDGIKKAFGDVTSFVSGIAGKIASLKGPLDYDATLLVPHGNAIMEGLALGMEQGMANRVIPLVSSIAGQISSSLIAADQSAYAAMQKLSASATAVAGAGSAPYVPWTGPKWPAAWTGVTPTAPNTPAISAPAGQSATGSFDASSGGAGAIYNLTSNNTFNLQGTPDSMLQQLETALDQHDQKLIQTLNAAR